MLDYPNNISEFEQRFATEDACRAYLFKLRWPNGFVCPRCSKNEAWQQSDELYRCKSCHFKCSLTSGTIFEGTRKPLLLWFQAIWYMACQKNGASAKNIQRILELGSYQTAWAWLHKIRRAMVRPVRDNLSGLIEVDETLVGGKKPGKRGRGAEGKILVGVAVEDKGHEGIGRIRLGILPDASAPSLNEFVIERVNQGSTIRTDNWPGYNELKAAGYERCVVGRKDLKLVHLVASLLKRWLLGTHQGAVSHEHLSYYLDEYTFRFNRRTSKHRGMLFMRILENAVAIESVSYKNMVKNIRGKKPPNHKI
jgi:transposase-like protein